MSLLNEMLRDLDKKDAKRPTILLMPALNRPWVGTWPKIVCAFAVMSLLSFLTYCLTYSYWHTKPITSEPKIKPVKFISMLEPVPQLTNPVAPTTPETNPDIASYSEPVNPSLNDENRLDPETASINKKMANLTPEEWHDEQLNKALEAMQDGADERAITLLELILTQFPASIEARENLAAIYISYEELDKADQILDEGMKYEPHNLRLTTMKSRILVAQGKHEAALKLLEQFKPDINKAPDYYGLLAAIFEALGRMNEAGSLYQTLVKIEPSNGQYWLGFGMALENKQARQQAIDAYKRASQSDNIQPSVRYYAEDRLKILQG